MALLLGMSERGVREVERRALAKLAKHPLLRQVWREHLAGELVEGVTPLTGQQWAALLGLARDSEERLLMLRVLHIYIHHR